MKKLLFFSLLIISVASQAQIKKNDLGVNTEIGHIKRGFHDIATLKMNIKDNADTTYVLEYQDMSYKQIVEYKFLFFKSAPSGLYDLFVDAFTKDKGFQESVTVDDTNVIISVMKELGTKYVYFSIGSSFVLLYNKDIDKLFGK